MAMNMRPVAAAVALLVTTTLLAVAGPDPSQAESSKVERAATAAPGPRGMADKAWIGYRLPRKGKKVAASGFVGARRAEGMKVYRVDPLKRETTTRFGKRKWAARFRASNGRRVSRARTSCAALLLGKYGTRRDKLQLAGVDVAVYHLLYGGAYRYDGAAQRKRVDRRPNGPLIRVYAKNLVKNYCRFAGPYQVRLTASSASAEVGDTIGYTATVRSRRGVAMDNIGLSVRVGQGAARTYVTNSSGQAVFSVPATRSGPLTVGLVANKLAYARVRFLVPRTRGASRVVQAGLKQRNAYPRSVTLPVMGQPVLKLHPDRPVRSEKPFKMTFRMTGNYPVRRPATVQVFGPFNDRASVSCLPRRVIRTDRLPVSGSGPHRSKPMRVKRAGFYTWRVQVAGDPLYNKPVGVCGPVFKVD